MRSYAPGMTASKRRERTQRTAASGYYPITIISISHTWLLHTRGVSSYETKNGLLRTQEVPFEYCIAFPIICLLLALGFGQ
jgi:hypothetical protein